MCLKVLTNIVNNQRQNKMKEDIKKALTKSSKQ
ncbi:hypothetical protein BXA08_05155 [Campylobacter lari]|nr:hypothetical protein [Campylobacter lari]